MRRIDTGGAVILLFCMVLLGGCAAGNETAAESAAPQISLPSQSEEAEITPPDTEDIIYEYITEELCAERGGQLILCWNIWSPIGTNRRFP